MQSHRHNIPLPLDSRHVAIANTDDVARAQCWSRAEESDVFYCVRMDVLDVHLDVHCVRSASVSMYIDASWITSGKLVAQLF